ncbi:MAG TPA: flavin reductase family protein [Nitrososphaerales archaeon]|nr:flavin reductase family protein [Nitrososphaerales archaeon]
MENSLVENLKRFMRQFPQGVTLITTIEGGRPRGMTVSSFTSLSLAPPLIMIAIAKDATSYSAFVSARSFNVQLLDSNQSSIAMKFATKIDHEEKFRGLSSTSDSNNNPIVNGALGYLECTNHQIHDVGDHSLIIARVTGVKLLRDSPPLVYHNRQFTTVADSTPSS